MTTKRMYGLKDLDKRLGKATVGEFLNTWRITEEIKLKDFSEMIGISVANICDIEKGRKGVSPQKAEQIAIACGLPPAFLVRLSIEEQLEAAGLKYKIEVKPAA